MKMDNYGNEPGHSKLNLLLAGDTVMYGRKSTKNDRSAKSLNDQREVCFEIAEEYGILVTSASWLEEEAGHGGDEWWQGGGESGLSGDLSNTGRIRPVFTQLMRGVIAGTVKCVICYSLDRLWRSAEICAKAIDLMRLHGCLVYDHNGPIDIASPSGRERVLMNSVNAQMQREFTSVACMRGVRKSREKGKLVGNCNSLGFRSAGPYSGTVRHVPEEHEVARRIFRLYYSGENGEGPLSPKEIAERLMDEGYIWTPDLFNKRSVKRTEATYHVIYANNIYRMLTDVRYIGKQKYAHETYDCPDFLYHGEPIVPFELFTRVQDKIKERSFGSTSTRNLYALTGRVRCGVCGKPLSSQKLTVKRSDGSIDRRQYWMRRVGRHVTACSHKICSIRQDMLDNYIDVTLAPLLLAEIRDRGLDDQTAMMQQQQGSLQRDLCEAERHYREELPRYHRRNIDPDMLEAMIQDAKSEIERLRSELRKLMNEGVQIVNSSPILENLSTASPAARRDAIRSVIRWVAVLPTTERIVTRHSAHGRPAGNVGSIVILTAWGTYHTARLYREWDGNKHANSYKMRPATVDEIIGGVADFPEPKSFHDGLQYSFSTKNYDYSAETVTPGYSPYLAMKTAEFEVPEP